MSQSDKIYFLCSRFPYPLVKGDKLRAFHQIRALSESKDIYLSALTDEKVQPEWIEALKPYCKEIQVYKLNYFQLVINVLLRFLFSKKPIQTAYFYNKAIARKIESDIARIKPDHLFCQLIRTTEYLRKIRSIPKTLDYMDALSAGMIRRKKNAKGIKKWIFGIEANRLIRYEHQILHEFDQCLIISASDRRLIFHYDNEDIKVVPNGIDLSYFIKSARKKDFDLLFTGNMSYPPNVQSALFLVEDIMPLVWKQKPDANLLISGANPVPKIKSLASEKVVVRGWVDDIRQSYDSSRIFIAPMIIGSGLQNKLLEAMAMKMPCITSELANRSLGAENEVSILVGKNAQEYADFILNLMDEPDKASELGEKGHSFVAENFNWSKSNEIILEIIQHGKAKSSN